LDVGLYGKLPSHGDFLRRRTSDAFVTVWDAWLQDCMAASRAALGNRWLDVYLTSPAWRFTGEAGICGPTPVLGLMVPSVDRVGRYFPLTIVAEVPPDAGLLAVTAAAPFFDKAERLVIETLEAEHVDFESFDQRVEHLADHLAFASVPQRVILERAAAAVLNGDSQACWQIPIGSVEEIGPAFEQLLFQKLSAIYNPLMFWWSDGSSIVEPSCLVARGLPHPETFAAFLDGSWAQHRWRPVPARVERGKADDLLVQEPSLSFRSAAASDVGRVRHVNQDAFIERSEVGLWAVADGLGGHSDGEHASRMVCDALADFTLNRSFEDTIEAVRARMQEVNDHLLLAATRSLLGERSGSTVVALIARGSRCAILWAGDSRVYRWRTGRLEQLTHDHSPAESRGGLAGHASNAVTRAVGAQSALDLDLCSEPVRAGDRFLLCSDGLTRTVPEPEIKVWVENPDIRASVAGLVEATLAAGAPDNVTALIVEAFEFV
jgi:type VI secretion system protein ImpM